MLVTCLRSFLISGFKTYDDWDVPVLHENWEKMFSRDHAFLNRLPMVVS